MIITIIKKFTQEALDQSNNTAVDLSTAVEEQPDAMKIMIAEASIHTNNQYFKLAISLC